MMVVGGNTHFASGRWHKRPCLCLSRRTGEWFPSLRLRKQGRLRH